MAKNRKFTAGAPLKLPVPEGAKSGDPVVVGALGGVLLTDRDAAGFATVDCAGVYNLSVVGKNKAGNSKVSVGDIIYLTAGVLNKNSEEGGRLGVATEEVVAGATTTIAVRVGY